MRYIKAMIRRRPWPILQTFRSIFSFAQTFCLRKSVILDEHLWILRESRARGEFLKQKKPVQFALFEVLQRHSCCMMGLMQNGEVLQQLLSFGERNPPPHLFPLPCAACGKQKQGERQQAYHGSRMRAPSDAVKSFQDALRPGARIRGPRYTHCARHFPLPRDAHG